MRFNPERLAKFGRIGAEPAPDPTFEQYFYLGAVQRTQYVELS
jgi:hypothetical protein